MILHAQICIDRGFFNSFPGRLLATPIVTAILLILAFITTISRKQQLSQRYSLSRKEITFTEYILVANYLPEAKMFINLSNSVA